MKKEMTQNEEVVNDNIIVVLTPPFYLYFPLILEHMLSTKGNLMLMVSAMAS